MDLYDAEKQHERNWSLALYVFIGLIILCMVVIIIFYQHRPKYDPYTFCLLPKVESHTSILIDKTDRYSKPQTQKIRMILTSLSKKMIRGEKLTIYVVDAENIHGKDPIFDSCSPGSEENYSKLTEHRRIAKEKFDKLFYKKLESLLSELLTVEEHPKSPILEDLISLEKLDDFGNSVTNRRIILISDMLQNSDTFNIYKTDISAPITKLRLMPPQDFSGIEIFIYVIPREKFSIQQHYMKEWYWPTMLNGAQITFESIL
ncbi:hypothetical protein [Teredinibacter turnerae]|uniref:hypothetical protein n=1 Tax=Teredinibacter turnerae TaxID=2426 RepID=UPI00036F293E|nr:hypothetical protein [Teredinibacter turnerae]